MPPLSSRLIGSDVTGIRARGNYSSTGSLFINSSHSILPPLYRVRSHRSQSLSPTNMPLPTPLTAAPTHESPSNSSTLSAPVSETSNTDPSSTISQILDSAPATDVGASQGSTAGKQMKSQVEEAAEKVFEQREGKEREGGSG